MKAGESRRRFLLGAMAIAWTTASVPAEPRPTPQAATRVLRVYVARHGQTEWNALKKYQGVSDIPLNEVGKQQAAALAERLAGLTLDRIYTSALARSKMTALAFGDRFPVVEVGGLNEQSLGPFEGTLADPQNPRYVELQRRLGDPRDTLDGGESRDQHFARVRAAVKDVLGRHSGGGTILLIGHGGTNALVLRELLSLTDAQAAAIRQDNEEVYQVELGAGAPRLFKLIPAARLSEL